MSAFLGPIHYWLYNKIGLQQEIVDELFLLGEKKGLSLEAECRSLYGSFEKKPLEEIIDQTNIHGWLQERVSQVEYQYAYCITKLLEADSAIASQLKELHKGFGARTAMTLKNGSPKATDIYKAISDNLLDGMPCDHANRILEQAEDKLVWERQVCVHSRYWEEVGGSVKDYYELRDAWLEGLVEALGFRLDRPNDSSYSIIRV